MDEESTNSLSSPRHARSDSSTCDAEGCSGAPGAMTWKCQYAQCHRLVHSDCGVQFDLHGSTEGSSPRYCSSECKSMAEDASSTQAIAPGTEYVTFEDLQSAIREDGAKYGVKINQRQTHHMDDRALVIFGHKAIQRGVFYCSQMHCPYTLRFAYDFTKMRYIIKHASFHGTHNHGNKNAVHARGKGVPFDKEFISMEALPDGIDRFQCRHCRHIILKKAARLSHLKDCQPYRLHLGLQDDSSLPTFNHAQSAGTSNRDNQEIAQQEQDEEGNDAVLHWKRNPAAMEYRFVPSDGKTSSRLECKHCGVHMNPKSNRLLTHLRDCSAYQGFVAPTMLSPQSSVPEILSDDTNRLNRQTSGSNLLITSTNRQEHYDYRRLESDADFCDVAALRSIAGYMKEQCSVASTASDSRITHYGLFDVTPPTKRARLASSATSTPTTLVCHFVLYEVNMNLFGSRVPVGILGDVTTDFTNPNLDKAACTSFLRECTNRRLAFAMVPSTMHAIDGICRSMGFTSLSPCYEHTLHPSALPSGVYPHHLMDHLSPSEDMEEVLECHTRFAATNHGTLFKNSTKEIVQKLQARILGCRDLRGTLRGYLVYEFIQAERTLYVHDLVYEDHRFLLGMFGTLKQQTHATTIKLVTADPHFASLFVSSTQATKVTNDRQLVGRAIQIGQLFSTHLLHRNFNYTTGLILQLVVSDPRSAHPTNLLLRFDAGFARVLTPSSIAHDAQLQVDIETFTGLIFGVIPFMKSLQFGKVVVTPSDPRMTRLISRIFDVDAPPTTTWSSQIISTTTN